MRLALSQHGIVGLDELRGLGLSASAETDGRRFHDGRLAFERDRRRAARSPQLPARKLTSAARPPEPSVWMLSSGPTPGA